MAKPYLKMALKLNLNDYIDDEAEDDPSSPSKDDLPNGGEDKRDKPPHSSCNSGNEIISLPKTLQISNVRKNRRHFIQQTREDDEKRIAEIINKTFNRSKREEGVPKLLAQSIIEKKEAITLEEKPQVRKFQIGFKKRISVLPKKEDEEDNNTKVDLQLTPKQAILNSLQYSYDKRLGQKLDEISTERKNKLNERLKEDEEILLNVFKTNNLNSLQNKKQLKSNVFFPQRIMNKGNSLLCLMRQSNSLETKERIIPEKIIKGPLMKAKQKCYIEIIKLN